MHVYVFMCGYACICVHMHTKPQIHTGCLPQLLSTLFLRDYFSLKLAPTVRLDKLANISQDSSCLCLSISGITGICHHAQLFTLLLEVLPVFMLVQLAHNQPSYLSPCVLIHISPVSYPNVSDYICKDSLGMNLHLFSSSRSSVKRAANSLQCILDWTN